ncbi:unnamed protein product [Meloidogyne enterolobii]|uniref:Uncharacterized protein n=1 Tax=Meloidogyne enterolobii TaxID=390850 RepID=A0ACB1A0S9_MELEN
MSSPFLQIHTFIFHISASSLQFLSIPFISLRSLFSSFFSKRCPSKFFFNIRCAAFFRGLLLTFAAM